MEKIQYSWEIYSNKDVTVKRYCHNCGDKAIFTDSGVRRHNANGKDIFEYAIFKCERGHTWNKMMGILNPKNEINKFAQSKSSRGCCVDMIYIGTHSENNVKVIEIHIKDIDCKTRLDKLLSDQIYDLSRNQIEKMIELGKISVNGQRVKPGYLLRKDNIIVIENCII